MENTTPDSNKPSLPNEFEVHSSSGRSYIVTEAEYQQQRAENKAKTQALIDEVDKYWQWLVATEPNKLTNELAAEDLFSVVVGHLMNERKVAGADIIKAVKRCLEESHK